jgi:exopolysaccharide biosynthesis polyprenyl glycosylphosphotransferase
LKLQEDDLNFFHEYAKTSIHSQQNTTIQENQYLHVKRFQDVIFSIIGLMVTLPVIIVFTILIKLETSGPAFFLQERVGINGRYFKIIKLRSMNVDAEKNGAQWAIKQDPRVTRVGYFIRKTRIDELPQLWNVLVGEMSLIGPRPERPIFTAEFNEKFPGFVDRLKIKPGLTGWAQVNGGYDITPDQKLQYDLYYIDNISFLMDIKIFIKTIKVCLTGEGSR